MYHYLNSKYFDKQNNLLELSEREGVSKISIRGTIKYRQIDGDRNGVSNKAVMR